METKVLNLVISGIPSIPGPRPAPAGSPVRF